MEQKLHISLKKEEGDFQWNMDGTEVKNTEHISD